MAITRSESGSVLHRLLRQPDEAMLETRAGGELVVARMRVWASLLLLLMPLANHLSGGTLAETLIGLTGAASAIAMSLVILSLAQQRGRFRWLPYFSGAWDTALTTLSLCLLANQEPAAGINSMVVWSFYLTSIFLTALRNDGRLVLWVGTLAFIQYALLSSWILSQHETTQLASVGYGTAGWGNVAQRLVVITIITIVTATIVLRMQRLIDLASTDSLTGISNRSWLAYRYPKLVAKARESGMPLSLAIIDLDHFKLINDEIGHLAGDRALCHFIAIAQGHLGDDDWIVRLGGEEFAVLMPVSVGDAGRRLNVLREQVAASRFDPGEGLTPCRLTFSAGISAFPEDGSDLTRLLGRADKRLSIAKRTGRNRVVIDDLDVQGLAG